MAPVTGTVERRDERIGIAAAVTAAFGAAAVLAGDGLGLHVVCPLRALTDIPCPGCGMTSVASSLADGDVLGALRTDPGGVAVVAVVAVIVGLHLADRARRSVAAPTDQVLAVVVAVALLVHWVTTALT